MRRRDFINLLGGTLAAWPIAAHAQQASQMRRVGVLMNADPSNQASQRFLAALSDALRDRGWSNDRNFRIEIRWSGGDVKLMRSYAEELVGIDPEVMVCVSTANLDALRRVTRTIPIVFLQVSDPVAQGYVQNLARPGGNLTGFSAFEISTGGKWLDLLKRIAPAVSRVAVIFNPDTSPQSALFLRSIETAAPSSGAEVQAAPVHNEADLEAAIVRIARQPNGGLIFPTDSFMQTRIPRVIELCNRHRVPAIYAMPVFAENGGLMSYTVDFVEQFKQAGDYVDRILKGAKPGDLPVQQPIKYKLVINLKTAKSLGLAVPTGLLNAADEAIE
jgi:putative tryptophan/tyrosine transport system substrate-binding protein